MVEIRRRKRRGKLRHEVVRVSVTVFMAEDDVADIEVEEELGSGGGLFLDGELGGGGGELGGGGGEIGCGGFWV